MFLLQSKKGDKDQESIQSQCLFMWGGGGGGGALKAEALKRAAQASSWRRV